MKILFITRKYPPSTGGMETAAQRLYAALAAHNEVRLLKWGGSNKLLPIVYPWLLLQAVWYGLTRPRPDIIYLQDGLMAPLGWIVQSVLRRPTVMTIHGKEMTYSNLLYLHIVMPCIDRMSRLVAVSHETRKAILRKLPDTQPEVIFNGLNDSFYDVRPRGERFAVISQAAGIPVAQLQKHKLLHTNGRLVRRKGVLWLIENVVPKLPETAIYLVSGDGPDRKAIEAAIARHGLAERVKLLGRVPDEVLRALYNAADIFLMPNIPVANDMEGFGLVALEAASCDRMVLAAKLEGIQDAIIDGKNGRLLEPQNPAVWVRAINRELQARSLQAGSIRRFTRKHYSWQHTAAAYQDIMRKAT